MKLDARTAISAVLLMITTSACSLTPSIEAENCRSIDDVNGNIERLEGSEISVCGYLKYEFEDKNLYQSLKAAKHSSARECLSLGMREGEDVDLSTLRDRWVRIIGIATENFCPENAICSSSCSKIGVFVKDVKPDGQYRWATSFRFYELDMVLEQFVEELVYPKGILLGTPG